MDDMVVCPKCAGTTRCAACDGTGIQKEGVEVIPRALRSMLAKCQLCKGSGECFTCKGRGEVKGSLALYYRQHGL